MDSMTTHRSFTFCPAHQSTQRRRPGRQAGFLQVERLVQTLSPRSTVLIWGEITHCCTEIRELYLTSYTMLNFAPRPFQYHNPGEQRIRPEAEDKAGDQDEGTGLHFRCCTHHFHSKATPVVSCCIAVTFGNTQ